MTSSLALVIFLWVYLVVFGIDFCFRLLMLAWADYLRDGPTSQVS
jgi:hypothetical protein